MMHVAANLHDKQTIGGGCAKRRGIVIALGVVLLIRLAIFLTGAYSYHSLGGRHLNFSGDALWVNFDGVPYRRLAQDGYPLPTHDEPFPGILCFFPLYPMLTRVLLPIMPVSAALVVVSNLASIAGFAFFYLWCDKLTDSAIAFAATLVLVTYPGAVFFSAALTESFFFLCVALALWSCARGKYVHAAIASGVATLARPTGIAVAITVVALCFQFYQQAGIAGQRRNLKLAWVALLSIPGLVIFELFLIHRYHNPMAYFIAQSNWHAHAPGTVPQTVLTKSAMKFYLERLLTPQVWNRGMMLVVVGTIVAGFLRPGRIPRLYFLLPAMIFLLGYGPGMGTRASSLIRFETAGLPCFLVIAWWLRHRRRILYSLCAAMFALQIYYAFLFTRSVWVG